MQVYQYQLRGGRAGGQQLPGGGGGFVVALMVLLLAMLAGVFVCVVACVGLVARALRAVVIGWRRLMGLGDGRARPAAQPQSRPEGRQSRDETIVIIDAETGQRQARSSNHAARESDRPGVITLQPNAEGSWRRR